MNEALLADGKALEVALPFAYETLEDLILKSLPILDEIEVSVLVHWDLWPGNIFVTPSEDCFQISGIIDWERAFWGDSAAESPVARGFYDDNFKNG